MLEFWNERYREAGYAYGDQPNEWFKIQLAALTPGTILLPAEGEGRNAVYAASQGWQVTAFDQSSAGRDKALALAQLRGVSLAYDLGSPDTLHYPEAEFDALALIYAHFPAPGRLAFHHQLLRALKSGGRVIFEAFSKRHIAYRRRNPEVGGPDNLPMLFDLKDILEEFPGLIFISLSEAEVQLSEGRYHRGTGAVIRFLAQKAD